MPIHQLNQRYAESRGQLILQYIHQHYKESISLIDIRLEINVNEKACQAIFKAITGGKSVHQYHGLFRLHQAFKDVADPDRMHFTIAGIAEMHGYKSANYFIKVFKKHYGMTPQEYRVQLISDQPA